jgi:hypothetical protein
MIVAERERADLTPEDAASILGEVQDYESPFVDMPI